MYTPVNPSYTIQTWGERGYSLHGHVIMMFISYDVANMLVTSVHAIFLQNVGRTQGQLFF